VMAILIGFQAVMFSIFTKVFAITEKLLPEDARMTRLFRHFRLETGLAVGSLLMTAGALAAIYSLRLWNIQRFGPMDPEHLVRVVASAIVLFTLGFEICLSSFFLSILGLRRK